MSVLKKCLFSHLDYHEWTSMEKLNFLAPSDGPFWNDVFITTPSDIMFHFVHKSFLDMNSLAPFLYFPFLFLREFSETLFNFGI